MTVLQKYLANNHTTEKEVDALKTSPKQLQSKLPISVQKRPLTKALNRPSIPNGKSPIKSKSPARNQASVIKKSTSDDNKKSVEKTIAPEIEEHGQPGKFDHLYKSHENFKSSDDDEHLVSTNK